MGIAYPWSRIDTPDQSGSMEEIGISLLTTYSLAFEAISLLLFLAIVGALVVARSGRTES